MKKYRASLLISALVALVFIPSLAKATNNAGDFGGSAGSNASFGTSGSNGGVAIGTGYALTDNAPTNGMIVQGEVGIGTTSPSYPLDVLSTSATLGRFSSSASDDATLLLNAKSGYNTNIGFEQAGALEWYVQSLASQDGFQLANSTANGNQSVLMVLQNGNVGIGSEAPIASLDLSEKTDALALPVGTSGTRPTGAALTDGEIRYNSTISALEAYVNGAWSTLSGGSSVSSQNVVTGSRALSTVYRNTTGKTMFVNVVVTYNANQQVTAVTDSSSSPSTVVANYGAINTSVMTFSFVVLNNNYYEIAPGASATLDEWTEWY